MKPLRLVLQEAVTAALQRITTANGFETNVAPGSVFRGRIKFGTDDPVPALTMFEPPVNEDVPFFAGRNTTASSERQVNYTLIVQGFIKDGVPHPTDPACVFSAEVTKVLAEERARTASNGRTPDPFGLGQHIDGVTIAPAIVRPSDDISATAYFWTQITFKLAEDMIDALV